VSVSVPRKSRLRFKDLVSVNGVEFWELDNLPSVPTSPADIYYRVEVLDRIDNLANRYYGDPNLWWVIAVANNMNILPTDLQPGAVIRIPSPTYVNSTLFASTKN
jgi:hypothetical protein